MRAIQLVSILVAACLLFLLGTRPSYACTCQYPGPSPSEAFEEASLVFSGTVLAKHSFKILGEISEVSGGTTSRELERVEDVYRIRVDRIWKGELDEIIYLSVYNSLNSCAGGASVGSRYLVYDGLSPCGRTRLLSSAGQDLAGLGRGRSPIPGTSAPTPRVMQASSDTVIPVEDQLRAPNLMPATAIEAKEDTSPPWPIFVLAAVPWAALIGLLALAGIRRMRWRTR